MSHKPQAIADAGTGYYRVLLLVGAVGFWAFVIGNAGIYRSLTTGAAAVWARLGFYMFVIGIAVGTAWGGVSMGVAGVLEELGTSAEAVALRQLDRGLVSITIMVV